MKPLSEQSKAVLGRYRAAEAPRPEVLERARAALHASIAIGAAPESGLDVPPPEPVPNGVLAKVFGSTLGKIGVAIAVVGLPTAWLLFGGATHEESSRETQAPVVTPAAADPPPNVQTPGMSSTEPPRAPEVPAPQGEAAEPPVLMPPTSKARKREAEPTPRIVLEEEAPAVEDTIDEEMALLSQAHAALRAGRPSEALSQVAEHARRFPNSKLADSREVTRILSLCAAGQKAQARAAAERFMKRRPGSPLTARVKNVCVD